MKFWSALLLVLCAVNRRYTVDGAGTFPGTPKGNGVNATNAPTNATNDDDTSLEKNITVSQGAQKPKYFTNEWRDLYSSDQLKNQPKWSLAEEQPEDGSYQTRIYANQWWVSAHTPCEAENLATSNGYMKLFFYFNKFNYQRMKYNLTYPIVFTVDSRPEPNPAPKVTPKKITPPTSPPKGKPKGKRAKKRRRKKTQKKPKVCPVKYSTYFYLPIPLTEWAPTTQEKVITAQKMPETKFYVRQYSGNQTVAYCKEQSEILALALFRDNIWTWKNYIFCAKYEAPLGQEELKLEVWLKQRTE